MKFFSRNENFESKLFFISGRNYPVDIYYLDNPCKDYIEAALETCHNIHRNSPKNSGDILVFLTGQEEISIFIQKSESFGLRRNDILIYPLFAGLNVDRQLDVFTPTPHNKRMTDSDSLFVIPASRFSLDQRAGRAGRVRGMKNII
jgi:HrpA-like RNA helicase